jgi:hypothetical protein
MAPTNAACPIGNRIPEADGVPAGRRRTRAFPSRWCQSRRLGAGCQARCVLRRQARTLEERPPATASGWPASYTRRDGSHSSRTQSDDLPYREDDLPGSSRHLP